MKKSYFHYLTFLLGVLYLGLRPATGQAQTYLTPTTGSSTITTCSGTLYDDGGASGNYSPNVDGTVTILPATTGNKVRLDFTTFSTESNYDYLYIYDGTTTSAPLIGTYMGTTSPGTIYGTTSSGALTLRFTSDYTAQYSGYAANISCVTSVPLPDLTVQGATVNPTALVVGGSLSASSLVYNLTGGTATSSNLGYYLSTDNTLSNNDVFLGSATGGALGAGQSSTRYSTLTIPVGTAAGTYYVLFAADYLNQVTESNENNNVTSVGITVQPASPDLVIQSAVLSSTSVQAGNALSFNCYIYNQGNSPASNSSVGFYLSTDATLDNNDALLTSQYGTTLNASGSFYRSGTAAIPSATTAGTYYILFAADYQNQVAESNETNNVTAVSFTVAPPGPDLVVTQQYLSNSYLPAGGTTSAYAYVNNIGNQLASSSNMGLYLSTNTTFDAADVPLTTSTGTSLAAAGSSYRTVTITVPTTTASGNYYVLFVADPANAVAESNENNNVSNQQLTVYAPTIDLSLSSAYLTPSQTSPGGTVSASVYEYNSGNANASSHRVGYYLSTNTTLDANDVLVGSSAVSTVSASYSVSLNATLTIPATTTTGSYYVLYVADDLGQITETNENNNVTYQTLQVVAPGVDLTISSAYTSSSSISAGNSLTADCYLNNLGTLATSSATVGYYLSTNTVLDASDVPLATNPAVTVNAAGSVYRSATLTIPAGTVAGYYYVLFVADPSNTVTETNENNNLAYQYLTVVAPTIDLSIYSAYLSASYVTAGSSVSTSASVYNLGNALANPVTVGYYLSTNTVLDNSDVLIGNTSLGSLSGGGSTYAYGTAVVPVNTPTGNYYVLFVADHLNQLVETNKSNNVTYQYIQVTATGPDLVMQSAALSTYSAAAGSTISATSYIYNQGNNSASSSNAGFYLSTNTTFDSSDVPLTSTTGGALGTYQSTYLPVSLTIPVNTTAGYYYILYVADPANIVAETNENNNVAYQYMAVTAPFSGTVVPASGSATITSCSAVVYDNGGFGNYANNSQGTLVINPATAGALVRLSFSSFNTEYIADYLKVYDGANTSAPLLGTFSGSTSPGIIMASNSNTTGALTLLFVSDASLNYGGFVANASCVPRLATQAQQTAGYNISVVPNPVANGNALRVQLSGAGQPGEATLTLLNSVGQLVSTQALTLSPTRQNEVQVSTAGLATGVYMLRLSGNGLNVVRRVVVE